MSEAVPQGRLPVSVLLCWGPVGSVHPVVGRSCLVRAAGWGLNAVLQAPSLFVREQVSRFGVCWTRPSVTQGATLIPHTYVLSQVYDLWTATQAAGSCPRRHPMYLWGLPAPLWTLATGFPVSLGSSLCVESSGTQDRAPHGPTQGLVGDNRLLVHSRAALRQADLMLLEAGAMPSLSHLPRPVSPPRAGSHSSVRAGVFMSFQQTHLTEKDAPLLHRRST